jgi:ribosomal protein S4
MIIFRTSPFRLVKRYARYSSFEIYFLNKITKKIRYGYKVYQKIFKRYRSKKTLRINVRKPRVAVKRKTYYGKALEIKNKYSYLIGGIHASKLSRFVRLNYSKIFSSARTLTSALESRLDILVAKTNLLPKSWIVKHFIKAGYVSVNGRVIQNVGFVVKKNTRVSFYLSPYIIPKFLSFFKQKSKARVLFWPFIPGFEFNRKTFSMVKYDEPPVGSAVYPFNFTINYFYRLYPR